MTKWLKARILTVAYNIGKYKQAMGNFGSNTKDESTDGGNRARNCTMCPKVAGNCNLPKSRQ